MKTDKELKEIARQSVFSATSGHQWAITMWGAKNSDVDVVQIIASAVAAAVRAETPWGEAGQSMETWMEIQRREFVELEAEYREKCERLHECVQKHHLGLGGEKIDKLVVEAVDTQSAIIEKAIEMVNTPGTTPETLPQAITAKIMERDGWHDKTIKRADAAEKQLADAKHWNAKQAETIDALTKAIVAEQAKKHEALSEVERLIRLDATNRDNLERTHKALVEAQLAVMDRLKEIATLRARLAALGPRPVSQQPTKEDADNHGLIVLIRPTGGMTTARYFPWDVHESWTHWLPCNLRAYGLEQSEEEAERSEFEALAIKEGLPLERSTASPQSYAHEATDLPWRVWQAARADKEGKA